MRVIDFHAHFYPAKVAEKALAFVGNLLVPATDGTRDGLIRSMKEAGICRSVGLPLVSNPANSESINRFGLAENYGEIISFGSVHPDEADPVATVHWIADHGLIGVKVHPEYQRFRFSEERLFPVWEACRERDLILLTHAGSDVKFTEPFHTSPLEFIDFLDRFPGLKLVISHFGGMDMWEDVEKYLLGCDAWFDLALIGPGQIGPEKLASMIRRHGVEKVLFGSDSPWWDQRALLDYIRSLPLSEEEFAAIFHRNAEKLLNIKEVDYA